MSTTPLHLRVRQDIETRITDGIWQPGSYLPSEQELMRRYRVSRTTIRKTISDLVASGKVVIERGVGTRVTVPAPDPQVGLSISELLRLQGRTPGIRSHTVTFEQAPDEICHELGLPQSGEGVVVRRVHTADDEVISSSQSWLDARILAGFTTDRLTADISLYDELARIGHVITTVIDRYTLIRVDEATAADLELQPGDPALAIHRRGLDASGLCLEVGRIVFRSDRYQPLYVIRRNTN